MPTGCSDPRCPVNNHRSRCSVKKSKRNFCKIHGKPSSVKFACDEVRGNHCERKRHKRLSRSSNANDTEEETRRKHSDCCRKCCKNKKCQTYKNTVERSTSTDPRKRRRLANVDVTRSHVSRKSGMLSHRHKDKEGPCECAHKRSCKRRKETGSRVDSSRGRGIRRYRSRRRRRGKCNWLINCIGRFCICAETPNSHSVESDMYVRSRSATLRNYECCSKSCNDKLHNLKKHKSHHDGRTKKKNKDSVGTCRCADSSHRNSHEDQSYLPNFCSKGLNLLRRSIDFRL